jgi:hypothetical protein
MFLLELAVIVLVAVGVGIALGRFAIPVGLLAVVLGAVPMGLLFVFESYLREGGDTSSLGMLSTIILMTVTPFGVVLMVVGTLRR